MDSTRIIPPPKSCLGNIAKGGVGTLRQVVAGAAVVHAQWNGGVRQEEEVIGQLEERLTGRRSTAVGSVQASQLKAFSRGDEVRDTESGRKGTVIRELKSGRLEVVDRKGNSWRQTPDKLIRR